MSLDPNAHRPTYWNNRYETEGERFVFGKQPAALARLLYGFFLDLQYPKTDLLDLGCGEGRDAVYLAQKGFQVTAVDVSKIGLDKLRTFAGQYEVTLDVQQQDLMTYRFTKKWPAIFSNNLLQFLGRQAPTLFEAIQLHTKAGGWNAISCFTTTCLRPQTHPHLFLLEPNQLREQYAGWDLFYYDERILYRPQEQHHLSFAQIVARKSNHANIP